MNVIVIASLWARLRLQRLLLSAKHSNCVLTMIARQFNEFVQDLPLAVPFRTAVPLADCLDQFPSCCHAEPPRHKSPPPAV